MYDQIERELKVLITKDEYETLLRSYDFGKPVIQKNVYFDDDKGSVRQLGALRIRTVNGKRILTLKIRKDSITQTELEKETDTENISAITDSEIRNWFALYQIPDALHPLHPLKLSEGLQNFRTLSCVWILAALEIIQIMKLSMNTKKTTMVFIVSMKF